MSATEGPATHVVTGELYRVRRGHGKRFNAEPLPKPSRRPARVAVTLALAHMIQRAIDRGEIRDQAEVARRFGVTRARVTQLINLTFLAPELQEQVLFISAVRAAKLPCEREYRGVARWSSWVRQRVQVAAPTDLRHDRGALLGTSARS